MDYNEITKKLNTIVLEEIKENYNKSETQRILSATVGESKSWNLAKEFEKSLNETMGSRYKVMVTQFGSMVLYEKIKDSTLNSFREVKTIKCPASKFLPYSYVMGKKIGKRNMEEIVKSIKENFNIED